MTHKVFIFKGRVYFGDTDAAGVVYHGTYINWLEAARIEMMDEIGCSYAELIAQGVGLSPVDISIQYRAPLRFSERFLIETTVQKLSSASVTLCSVIKHGDMVCCEATVKLACIDEKKWKPTRIPQYLADAWQ